MNVKRLLLINALVMSLIGCTNNSDQKATKTLVLDNIESLEIIEKIQDNTFLYCKL